MKRTKGLLGAVLAAVLALLLLLPAVPSAWAESGTAGDVRWSMDSNGSLTISGSGAIPDYEDGYDAPWPRRQVTSIRIQSGVTAIGSHAFDGCDKAASVEIGDTVCSIGDEAFKYCGKLTSVRLPSAVTTLGEGVFMECSALHEILVDNRNAAFISQDGVLYNRGVTRLVLCPAARTGSYTVADTVTEIGSCAFFGCEGLTEIDLPASVTSIGDWAFFGCTHLPTLALPDALRTIGRRAFVRCDDLATMTLPAGLTSIGDMAFQYSGLTTVTIPAGAALGENVFVGCTRLASVYVAAGSTRYASRDGVLFDRDLTTLLLYPAGKGGKYTIPDTVTTVAAGAFGSSGLTIVTVPDSVRTLGEGAFNNCKSLIQANLGAGLTEIPRSAFINCTALESFAIPAGVKTVCRAAFAYCDHLRSVTLARSVTTVEPYAFMYCSQLAQVDLGGAVTIGESAFTNCSALAELTLPDSVRSVGREAFYGCHLLRAVTFGSGLAELDARAFYWCTGLEAYICTGTNPNFATENGLLYSSDFTRLIRVPEGFRGVCVVKNTVTDVDAGAFSDCSQLTGAVLGDKVRTIGRYAFGDCYNMHRVALGKALTSVGDGAFGNTSAKQLDDVWYTGTDSQWLAITVGENNTALDRATLHMVTKPVMAFQPEDVTAKPEERVIFSAAVVGGEPVQLQWYYRSADGKTTGVSKMVGSDTNNLRVPATAARNGQQYRMMARMKDGTVLYSDWATLYVTPDLAITGQPADVRGTVGQRAQFTVTAVSSDTVSYRWQYRAAGTSVWRDSSLNGHDAATLTVPITVARNGQQYRCLVSGAGKTITSDTATLTIRPVITKQPHDITAPIGESAWFKVAAAGTGLTYQWQYKTTEQGSTWKNSGMPGNREPVLKVPTTAARNGQQYRCVITDAYGETKWSEAATLRARLVITGQPKSVTARSGDPVTLTVKASGAGLIYQWQYLDDNGNWKYSGLSGATTATLTMTMGASRDGTSYRCRIRDRNGVEIYSDVATLTLK